MPRLHFVKKARRPLPQIGVEVGDSYFWWATRMKGQRSGTKHFRKERPKPSELISSPYGRSVAELQESMEWDAKSVERDDLVSARDDWAQQAHDIASEEEGKLDNMPEGLKEGDTGQMLQERLDACNQWAEDIENVDIPEREEGQSDEDYAAELQAAFEEITNTEPSS